MLEEVAKNLLAFATYVEEVEGQPIFVSAQCAKDIRALLQALDNYKRAYNEWLVKTDWVQQTIQPGELGMHRADVLRKRIARAIVEGPTPSSAAAPRAGCVLTSLGGKTDRGNL